MPVKPKVSPRLTLLTASGVCSLIVLDTNIVAVTLPTIARDLGANFADIEWVVSAYMLAFAALLLPAGSIADHEHLGYSFFQRIGQFIIGCRPQGHDRGIEPFEFPGSLGIFDPEAVLFKAYGLG